MTRTNVHSRALRYKSVSCFRPICTSPEILFSLEKMIASGCKIHAFMRFPFNTDGKKSHNWHMALNYILNRIKSQGSLMVFGHLRLWNPIEIFVQWLSVLSCHDGTSHRLSASPLPLRVRKPGTLAQRPSGWRAKRWADRRISLSDWRLAIASLLTTALAWACRDGFLMDDDGNHNCWQSQSMGFKFQVFLLH